MHPAYVAGFVDADGCISVNYRENVKSRNRKSLTNRTTRFHVSLIVVQKNEKVIRMLFDQYGGCVNITKRGIHRYFRWTVSGKALLKALREIRPYLIDKFEQANIAIESAEHQASCGRGRYRAGCEGTQPLSDADLAFRRSAWLRNKGLNTCHKFRAAAETKSSEPERVCDSPSPAVMSGDAAKASCA